MEIQKLKKCAIDYTKFKNKLQKEADTFLDKNMFFAFSRKQFETELEKRMYNEEDVIAVGNSGGLCHKDKYLDIIRFFRNMGEREKQYFEIPENFYGAFYYNLVDTEFCYSQDLNYVLDYMNIDKDYLEKYPKYKEVIKLYLENTNY